MRIFSYSVIVAVFLCFSISGSAQGLSTGLPEIDQQLHNAGLSLRESTILKMGAQSEKTMPVSFYGGNLYYIGTVYNGADQHPVTLELSSKKGDLYYTGTQGIELDLRYLHGAFSMTLTLKKSKNANIPEILLVQAYRSVTNASTDHLANLEDKSFYTLEGITIIEEERKKITDQLENHLATELTKQGYSVSGKKTLIYDGKDTMWPYTFYRENDYVIFAMVADGTPTSFEVIVPRLKEENPFGGDPIEREERLIKESAEGTAGLSFRNKNPNLWKWAIRPNYDQHKFGSLSVFIIGYHSAGNTSMQASDNKPEKFYVR